MCLPLVYVAARSWQAGAAAVAGELFRERTFRLLLNTLAIAIGVTLCATLIGLALAWCVERTDLPGRRAWRILAGLPLAMPAFVASYTWSSLGEAFRGMGSAVLILTLSSYPLVFLPVAAALRGADPGAEHAARSLGCTAPQAFVRAVLPQIRPALGAGALLVLTHMFAEFGALSLLRVQTFTTAIFEAYELRFDSATAALLSAALLALCLPAAWAEMRLRQRGRLARTAQGSPRRPSALPLGHARLPVMLAIAALVAVALVAPLGTLGYWLTVGRSHSGGLAAILPAISGSAALALPGALAVVALALPLVLASTRHGGPLAAVADRLPYVVHGLPGIVVALSLIYASIHYAGPLYQTLWVLMAAYAVLYLPLAQSALRASFELAPLRLEQAARCLGRGPFAAFASVTLPAVAPGIGAALALMTLELMRELTATLMLAPTGTVTLATEVWSLTNDGAYAAAAPFAALLVALSAAPVYVFTRQGIDPADI